MFNNYQIISPSLEGILDDAQASYGGIKRPSEIIRVLDGPAERGRRKDDTLGEEKLEYTSEKDRKIIESYYQDLCSVFFKRFSSYVVEDRELPEESIRLQAMMQEIVKIMRLRKRM